MQGGAEFYVVRARVKLFEAVYGAIRALMKPVVPASRPIGFTTDLK